MKKLLILAGLLTLTVSANAQTKTNVVVSTVQVTNLEVTTVVPINAAVSSATGIPDSFLSAAEGYFTSFNTNLAPCFATNHGQLWTGATLQNNVNLGQEIGGSYNAGKHFSVEALCLNSGVFNTILGAEAGPAYSLTLVDTRVSAIVGAGERFSPSQFYVAGHLRLEKALTTHTFMGLDVGIQSGGKTDLVPQLTVLTGFSF